MGLTERTPGGPLVRTPRGVAKLYSRGSAKNGGFVTVVTGGARFESYYTSEVHPLCGDCTTDYDMEGRVPKNCRTRKTLLLPD